MACPFSFMSRASSSPAMPLVEPVSAESLSAALREGTAASHKAVERSEGVRRLMALPSVSSSSLGGMSREEYIRWQVALLCVYSALETALDAHVSSPLFVSSDFASLLPTLYRASTLKADVTAHLRVLAPADNGARVSADQLGDIMDALAAEPCAAHEELTRLLEPASVQREHIVMLHPLLATATLGYVRRLVALGAASTPSSYFGSGSEASRPSTPSCSDSILSFSSSSSSSASPDGNGAEVSLMALFVHAYVRYLGDLSGGQHIVRRARRLWPVETDNDQAELGFAFYNFDEAERNFAASGAGRESKGLKDAFRAALDRSGELSSSSASSSQTPLSRFSSEVTEANAAFLANAALFDALAGVEPGSYLVREDIDGDSSTTAGDVARALRQRSGKATIPDDSYHAHLHGMVPLQGLAAGMLSKAGMALSPRQAGGKQHKTNLIFLELPWHPHVVATAAVVGATCALGVALTARLLVTA